MIRTLLLVGLGGFAGSSFRYLVQRMIASVTTLSFPYGTLTINISGSLLIGIIFGIAEKSDLLSPEARLFLITGVLGGFTTFSTFTLDVMTLLRDSQYLYSFLYISVSLAGGIAATFSGFMASKLF